MVRRTVFGLDVLTAHELSFLRWASAVPTGRTLELSVHSASETPAASPRSELLSEERRADGELLYDIREQAGGSYCIAGASYGNHLLAADGRRLDCTVSETAAGSWQRLLIAQALPFAAVLRGLEVFHASAVSLAGDAVAFAGSSGSGKTSLALECVRRGATFLADDVLAVEPADGMVLAHPGSAVAAVERGEAERTAPAFSSVEVLAENERELLVPVAPSGSPVPLRAVFFLHRTEHGPATPRFNRVTEAGALLGATFNFLLGTPERLYRLLEVCALIARTRVERIDVCAEIDAAQLADAVLERVDSRA